ncbi:YihY/virulence factor BrkB family protein [Pararhizobium mangrovi]|nr:YihY/virulence factor BrkB family protein [Pararhizobium mangrovi]
MDRQRLTEKGRGRRAYWPQRIPRLGWWDIARRVFTKISEDRVMLIAAGSTFYLLLAIFPALAAFVSLYGLVADPSTIADHIAFLSRLMPEAAFDLINSQLKAFATANSNALSFGFVFGLLAALWSANNGIKTLFDAMNIAYEEREHRSFIRLNLVSFVFTFGAMIIAALLIVVVGVIPALLAFLRLTTVADLLIRIVRWPLMLIFIAFGISIIYRFGPSRRRAKWRWQVPGAVLATVVWIIASIAFSWYLQSFANYNATYGSLGAAIGFLMWTWISLVILIVGAEINAEMEHQTGMDSTIGEDKPMGERGARAADTLGASANEQ